MKIKIFDYPTFDKSMDKQEHWKHKDSDWHTREKFQAMK